jgi:DNA-binding NtrC family response regulator
MKVLIVDDEKNMRLTLADLLKEEGYQVETAATGEEALALCQSQHNGFDAVLLDVRMPGIDGVEVFRRIRRHQPGQRVLLMSAFTVDDLKHAALDEGAIAFLPKPLDVQLVLRLIREATETAILVVENDEVLAAKIRDTVKTQGYRVTIARSPHDALELMEQIRFDIVLIDVALPSMTGLDLYLAIKRITPSAVAIMISGFEEEFLRIAREAVQQTAYTFLVKPLDLDCLIGLLARIGGQQASGAIRKPPSP